MVQWLVLIPVRTEHRTDTGFRAAGIHLREPVRLSEDLALKNSDSAADLWQLIVELRVEASSISDAGDSAWARVSRLASVMGFFTGIDMIPQKNGMSVSSLDRVPRQARAMATITVEGRGVSDYPPERITTAYENYMRISPSDREELATVLELFTMSWHETYPRTKFLTLVALLELLAPTQEPIPEVRKVVNDMTTLVNDELRALRGGPRNQLRRMKQLKRRLGGLASETIADRLKRLLQSSGLPFDKAEEAVDSIYPLRSTLSHGQAGGSTPVDAQIRLAREVAERCITSRYFGGK
jgi:hypothetical protein